MRSTNDDMVQVRSRRKAGCTTEVRFDIDWTVLVHDLLPFEGALSKVKRWMACISLWKRYGIIKLT